MKRLKLELPPEVQAEDALNRAALDEEGMRLARLLQALAFSGRTDVHQPAAVRMRADPEFRPTPLYVQQAYALRQHKNLAAQLRMLLGGN